MVPDYLQENLFEICLVGRGEVCHAPFDFELALMNDCDAIANGLDLTQFM